MVSRLPEFDETGEVGDLSTVDPEHFKPLSALPLPLQAKLRGRPKSAVTKEAVKIRLDADLLAALRASGSGWQTRVNDAIRQWLAIDPATRESP